MTPPRRRYPTDLTDAEWQLLGPFILAPRPGGHLHDDKARVHHPMRSIDVRFRTPVQQSGKTATGIQAEQVIQALASGKRPR